METRFTIQPEHVALISEWLRTRGGIAIWRSQLLGDSGLTVTTPRLDEKGQPATKPGWKFASQPDRIITDPAEVLVSVDEEVNRFYVAVRMGSQGLMWKVTDGGTRRIRAAVAKAGEGAYYVLDYATQEAVIMRPVSQKRLDEFNPSE
jgi:hypothetical protein